MKIIYSGEFSGSIGVYEIMWSVMYTGLKTKVTQMLSDTYQQTTFPVTLQCVVIN